MKFGFVRRLANAPPPWSELDRFARHASIRYSGVWLLIVPALVKAIEVVRARAPDGTSHIPLPLGMELLFGSAIFASLASIVYSARCPRFVRDYKTPAEYAATKKGPISLANEFAAALAACNPPAAWTARNLEQVVNDFGVSPLPSEAKQAMLADKKACVLEAQRLRIRDESVPEAYWALRQYIDELRPGSRYFYLVLIALAILMATVTLVLNVLNAAKYILLES